MKVIARIKGGVGNQLFCYAAARRLALANGAELVLDDVTGFVRDHLYRSEFGLGHFSIHARRATAAERLEPFERYRRGVLKWFSRARPYGKRPYVEQEGCAFDRRLLDLKMRGTVYIDGLWQSARYFEDVALTIREDLRIKPPRDVKNHRLAAEMAQRVAVAVHVRWFKPSGSTGPSNVKASYYDDAISLVERQMSSPHYYIFSDDPATARAHLSIPEDRATFVSHNQGPDSAYADLWLMTQCRHFITANSTFSWWGAWLGGGDSKLVVTPSLRADGIGQWGFDGLIPESWMQL